MTKDELEPIDVSKYKVTETGQVLKMTNFEKHANLDSIKTALIREQIPFEYNEKELTIKIKGIDMTDMLLAVHDYSSEFIRAYALEWGDKADETYACKETEKDKIADLEKENAALKEDLRNKKLAIQNRNGRIKELQEENAELKAHHKSVCESLTNTHRNIGERLKEAKEIIRELLNSCFGYNSKTVNYEVKVKAEQFLKEVSEWVL